MGKLCLLNGWFFSNIEIISTEHGEELSCVCAWRRLFARLLGLEYLFFLTLINFLNGEQDSLSTSDSLLSLDMFQVCTHSDVSCLSCGITVGVLMSSRYLILSLVCCRSCVFTSGIIGVVVLSSDTRPSLPLGYDMAVDVHTPLRSFWQRILFAI